MTMPGDLSSLFGGAPEGSAQDMRYRQGIIRSFNPVTLSNTVEVGGAILTDLPILGVGEATLLVPGAVVGLLLIGQRGRGQTLAIDGRLVKPNTTDADNATSLLSANTKSDFIITQETISTFPPPYSDLTTVGPTVTVVVRNTGRLQIAMGCQMQRVAAGVWGGIMVAEMTGANVIDPVTFSNTLRVQFWQSITGGGTFTAIENPYSTAVFSGLSPGETTITAKYASMQAGVTVDIGRRFLGVTIL